MDRVQFVKVDFQIHALRANRRPISWLRAIKRGTKFVQRHEKSFINY